MKRNVLFLLWLSTFYCLMAEGQFAVLSPKGNYIAASIKKSNKTVPMCLVIQSAAGQWKKQILNCMNYKWVPGEEKLFYSVHDSLFMLIPGTDFVKFVVRTGNFDMLNINKQSVLLYSPQDEKNALVAQDYFSGNERRFHDVTQYEIMNQGAALMLISTSAQGQKLRWVDLVLNEEKNIWSGSPGESICRQVTNPDKTAVAFLVEQKQQNAENKYTLWHYGKSADKAEMIADDKTVGIDSSLSICKEPLKITQDGNKIILYLQEKRLPKRAGIWKNVNIWSYIDAKSQSQQKKDLIRRQFAAVAIVAEKKLIRLEQENEHVNFLGHDDYVTLVRYPADIFTYYVNNSSTSYSQPGYYSLNDYNWNKMSIASAFLVSLQDGNRTLIKDNIRSGSQSPSNFCLSPRQKYVVFFDEIGADYWSYEISSGRLRNLTQHFVSNWTDSTQLPRGYFATRIVGYNQDEDYLFFTDSNDNIWKTSLKSGKRPVKLTSFKDAKTSVKFSGMIFPRDAKRINGTWVLRGDEQVLVGVNIVDRNGISRYDLPGGLYRIDLSGVNPAKELIAVNGKYEYSVKSIFDAGKPMYLLERENFNEAPLLVTTTDFKQFYAVDSDIADERKYPNTEILHWKLQDGTVGRGILYKPDTLIPGKKYPVICTYYEQVWSFTKKAGGEAEPAAIAIQPRDWVKKGYVVFVPDISYYKLGRTMESFLKIIESGVKCISRLPFIDRSKIGAFGFSFGGFQTNYLVSHSNLFAAAASAAGGVDFFSYFGTEADDEQGYSYMAGFETGQNRLGVTPWENPDIYFNNSTIFFADRIRTPLLLMHAENDHRVPYSQSVELFNALRRLGKPGWLISHQQAHSVPNEKFMIQFFDHYLQGKPAPVWMTRGVPYREGITDKVFEYDNQILTPPGGGIRMENEYKTQQQKALLRSNSSNFRVIKKR